MPHVQGGTPLALSSLLCNGELPSHFPHRSTVQPLDPRHRPPAQRSRNENAGVRSLQVWFTLLRRPWIMPWRLLRGLNPFTTSTEEGTCGRRRKPQSQRRRPRPEARASTYRRGPSTPRTTTNHTCFHLRTRVRGVHTVGCEKRSSSCILAAHSPDVRSDIGVRWDSCPPHHLIQAVKGQTGGSPDPVWLGCTNTPH